MRSQTQLLPALIAAAALAAGCPDSKTDGDKGATAEGAASAVTAEKAEPVKETGPIATVNGKDVDRAEFDEMYEKMTRVYTKRGQSIPENVARRHKKNIFKRLIEKALLTQEIEKQGVTLTDAELEEGLAKYKEMFRTDANFERYLQNSSTTLDKIKDNIRFNKTLDKLLEKDSPVQITEAETKEYYEQNKRRYQDREQVKASHILMKLDKDAPPDQVEAARKKAVEVAKEAKKKGADFEALARKYSGGPTAPKGGSLGYFSRGRMAKEFEDVAFKLKPGQVSDPVLTKFGWHIIKSFDHRPPGEKPFDEVKDSIGKLLESRERRLRKSKILRDLKATAKIEQHIDIPEPEPDSSPVASMAGAAGGPGITTTVTTPGGMPIKQLIPAITSGALPTDPAAAAATEGSAEDAPAEAPAHP